MSNSTSLILRRLGAVLAGLLVVFILTLGTDAVFHATGVFPALGQPMSDKLFLLATAYRTLYGIIGGYVIARLAPDHPMGLALLMGLFGFIVCILGAVVTWNRGPEFGPHWYPIALVVTAIPCAWVGAKLAISRRGRAGNGTPVAS
jgi:hypothetical protein